MRKTLAILMAVLLLTTLLMTGALAQGNGKQNNGSGFSKNPNAGSHGQSQNAPSQAPGQNSKDTDQDENDDSQTLDEQSDDASSEEPDTDDNDDADTGDEDRQPGGKNGNKPGKTDDEPDRLNTGRIAQAISQVTDTAVASNLTALLNTYKTAAAGEDEAAIEAARKALLDALAAAGVSLAPNKEHERAGGVLMNIQAVTEAIGKLTDTETAAQLSSLLSAYQAAAAGVDNAATEAALKALLDALDTVGISLAGDGAFPPHGNNIDVLREKILSGSNHGNGTLLALMHAYENAFRFRFEKPEDDTQTDTETDAGTGTGTDAGTDPGTGTDSGLDQAAQALLDALDSAN